MKSGTELDLIVFIAKEEQTRLDFIVKLNRKTGDTIGPAWKNFGYRGPRYHDGFLYGKVDGKKELTGTCYNYRGFNFESIENFLVRSIKNALQPIPEL